MGVDPDDEPFLFETLDEQKLTSIISTQQKVIAHKKKTKAQWDARQPDSLGRLGFWTKNSSQLWAHLWALHQRSTFFQTICSSQKWKLLSPTAHVNAHWIVAFKFRNPQTLDGLLQELTAIYHYEVLLQLYEEAVNDQPYSFLLSTWKNQRKKCFPYALTKYFK